MDGAGNAVGTEEFRAAAGLAGRRYFSTVDTRQPEPHREAIDLVVDDASRPVRVRIDTGSHAILLTARGESLSGTLDGDPAQIEWGPDLYLDYLSPAFSAATASRLGGTADIEVVHLEPVTCRPTRERQRYELVGEEEVATPVGRFSARRWRYTSLRTGWTRSLWVAGDLVVSYEGLFELASYEPGQSGPFPR
jgi:hypothetical protein